MDGITVGGSVGILLGGMTGAAILIGAGTLIGEGNMNVSSAPSNNLALPARSFFMF